MIDVVPPAVENMCRKSLNTVARKLPPRVGREGQAPLLVEEVGRERGEREDRRVEGHAQHHDEPVRGAELLHVREDDLVARPRLREAERALAVPVHHEVDQVAQQAQRRTAPPRPRAPPAHPKWLATDEIAVEAEQGAQARDRERDAEGERQLLAPEPAREDGALRHDERLGARAEDEPAGRGDRDARRQRDDARAEPPPAPRGSGSPAASRSGRSSGRRGATQMIAAML